MASKPDLSFQVKLRGPADAHAYFLLQRKTSEATFTLEADSINLYKACAEVVPETNKDLKLKLDLSNQLKSGAVKGTLSLDHALQEVRYKVSMSEGPTFKFSAVAGRPGLGAGVDLGFDWLKGTVCAYDGILYWGGVDSKVALKYVSHPEVGVKAGDFVLFGYKGLTSKVTLAFKATKTAQSVHSGEAGLKATLNPKQSVCLKVNSSGVLSCAMRQQLWQSGSLLYAVQVSQAEGHFAQLRAGFKLKING